MKHFRININTKVEFNFKETNLNIIPIKKAIDRWNRDTRMVHENSLIQENNIILLFSELEDESYCIDFNSMGQMEIRAGSELGFIYALLYLSEEYLNVHPFWFWNDEVFKKREYTNVPLAKYNSPKRKVRYRGWFINDEVLIQQWTAGESNQYVWEMALEALLRCGGNMVIPGTDKNSVLNRKLASDMGLWITHHHAEPLGAEMFARAYPDLNPSYAEHKDLFHKLWREAVAIQKDTKVIWNLGFRGQGDYPFWLNDPQYKTSESRGKLISDIIKKQYSIIQESIENPVCCSNLYGETMELYKEGLIDYSQDLIKVWADNGYGKMVSRRQENNNLRIYALPDQHIKEDKHGVYYHVSFYDLQAANHITMFPNKLEFVKKELLDAFEAGADDYLILNCSNIKPHVYFLDAVADLWNTGELDIDKFEENYINTYFDKYHHLSQDVKSSIQNCFKQYGESTVSFGIHEDERAGEQFYNYLTRIFLSEWMKGNVEDNVESLQWATGDLDYAEQINWYKTRCLEGHKAFNDLNRQCEKVKSKMADCELFEDSIDLQVKIHLKCLEGALEFCKGFEEFQSESYKESFFHIGRAAEYFEEANLLMRGREHGKWKDFYKNDCLTDIKQTGYLLRHLMGYIRNIGDGPYFYHWQRDYLYSKTDRKVILVTNFENHMTDWEIYELMKKPY